ncbi:CRISPR-associated Cas2 family protein [Hydrogenispora ethanolica]|uniref:CRISPR-associated Cas2 family protein n=1 Tax=Hydrogenispora ethanolica TaxID=1082276 RepID=A0A4R1RQ89_HYDET|nr:CRISPR-associated Cas2 family protein [Hydrogenispora ethanolica]
MLKKSRQYLYWVQNSVFEGEISEAKYKKYVTELKKIINLEEDSVIIYNLRTSKYSSREVIGLEKGGQSNIL